LNAPGKERSLVAPKGCKLPSLMPYMINRRVLLVVILLSSLLFSGCSGVLGEDPGEQANQAIKEANASISEHNRLFDEARSTYKDVKEQIESGDDPSQEKNRITEAKNALEEARRKLKDARESLSTVEDLDVDPKVKEYARLLSDAMEAQLAAEAKEVQFYGILEKDPALENDREKALDLLSEVGVGYREAKESYAKAQELADSNPNLIEND
jgi:DNA repair exonuclease SbcCD ATPase subunit